MRVDETGFRNQCRISCCADLVIEHTLPYLLPAAAKKGDNKNGEDDDGTGGDEDIGDEGDSSDDNDGMDGDY